LAARLHAKFNGKAFQILHISDVNVQEYLFVGSFGAVIFFSLVAGFVSNIRAVAVPPSCAELSSKYSLRAAMAIPSALSLIILIIHLFLEPAEQAQAIALFAGTDPTRNTVVPILVFVRSVVALGIFFKLLSAPTS
jgi:hypothetical protein